MRGFYHPDRGCWQVQDDTPQTYIDAYPAGTAEVGLPPSPYHAWDGAQWVDNTPTQAEIDAAQEAAIQALVDGLTAGADRDKAMAMLVAELLVIIVGVVKAAFGIDAQTAVTRIAGIVAAQSAAETTASRSMVRDRLVAHLRTIKGL